VNPDLEWQRRYEVGNTPWDKGVAAPALIDYLRQEPMTGRILVPGCGKGHEARALGENPAATVLGLDLSPLAIEQARRLGGCGVDPDSRLAFTEGDFFALPSPLHGTFDWIVEHTCFCAIEPRHRLDYVRAASGALRKGGRIFAIFFINPDVESGPPFAVSKEELSPLFEPHFDLVEDWVPRNSFPGRENREWVQVLKKR
jgi:cyclopropane fatty-acyl-phospholipid synthase-like methyltransferase